MTERSISTAARCGQCRTSEVMHSIIRQHYQRFAASGERFRNIWEEEKGIAFIDRGWLEPAKWEAPHPEPQGFYHFYIQSKRHLQCGEFNGRPSRIECRIGTVQNVRPDETVHTAGVGATRIFQISFSSDYLTEYLDTNFVMPRGVELRTRQLDDLGLEQIARAQHEALDCGIAGRKLYFDEIHEAALGRILALYAPRSLRENSVREILVPARARAVIDYIEANLAEDLRLSELCSVARVSRAHFARGFRKVVGMSPHKFVMQRRLSRAIQLVRYGDTPMKEIARLCGFADAAHLTRCFKSQFSSAPSLLRE
ncbi:helix-turn-helix domain-containing protein [Acidicapsa ligni]|uniref:helix-turn-helix domain-containing protein n=1 Tax=Acidicapsa ligni TaxID=542300 RepID=UPI0021E08F28|nr:AraC family transcriptional regulator [Acidicapsa ligni]